MRNLSASLASVVLACIGCGSSGSSSNPAGSINGCVPSDFTAAPATGTVSVKYGDPIGLVYAPRCVSIAAGQSVTFAGDVSSGSTFSVHPLRPGGANGGPSGTTGNPIAAQDTGSTYTVSFPAAGTFTYFCRTHEQMGMYGAIQVR